MINLHLKKGFSPRLAGAPAQTRHDLPALRHVGVTPYRIPFIKPRLLVSEGDSVAIGSPLFEDKRDTRIRFHAPGGGKVSRIQFGPRRIIQEIVIDLDDDEEAISFDIPEGRRPAELPREELIDLLLTGGIWPFLRCFPYMDLASPDMIPPSIMVRLGDDDPFTPDPRVYLEGQQTYFLLGIEALSCLCPNVVINTIVDDALPSPLPDTVKVQRFNGHFPAGNPGVQLYHTKTGPELNRSWFIDGQDVALLGEFWTTRRYPIGRIMSVGGSLAPAAGHVASRAGVPLGLLSGSAHGSVPEARYIVGGIFSGYTGSADSFMGFYQNALNLIDEGDREEPFGFIRPGFGKPSYSRAFLSSLHRRSFPMDCCQHGEVRACVNCGTCTKICPVDILPQFTMKCLVADEVEEALAHGLLDCAECGLCTYVCPSKIELREIFRAAKAQYYKETT
ncbi:MAG: hypothetical protein CR984_04145 [Proteobacteria bacterium]|nr:MAG: hypothetical protein CR984_04145 [Pseudomonadota bacterium]PIE66720.1 MAG: hypothetical protein CSA23_07730 [Deltaproteobacteria bacterium]